MPPRSGRNGRVVYNDGARNLHLLDRATRGEVPLPGVNMYADPGNLSVSNSGLIAFDDNGNGPTRVVITTPSAYSAASMRCGRGFGTAPRGSR